MLEMAGKKKLNTVLKKEGSKYVRDEIEPEKGEVLPTYQISIEGERAFKRICHELEKLGVLSPAYSEFITLAAGAIGDIEIATKDLIERGHISITERGETKNPSFTIKNSSQVIAHRYLTSLGLSPTSIGNLIGKNPNEINEFDSI